MKVNPPKYLTLQMTCETRVIKSVVVKSLAIIQNINSFDLIETFNILLPSQRRKELASALTNS